MGGGTQFPKSFLWQLPHTIVVVILDVKNNNNNWTGLSKMKSKLIRKYETIITKPGIRCKTALAESKNWNIDLGMNKADPVLVRSSVMLTLLY